MPHPHPAKAVVVALHYLVMEVAVGLNLLVTEEVEAHLSQASAVQEEHLRRALVVRLGDSKGSQGSERED